MPTSAIISQLSREIYVAFQRRGSKLRPCTDVRDSVTLSPHYAGYWLDSLAELATNLELREALVADLARALGRATDRLIVAALGQGKHAVGSPTERLTRQKVLAALETLRALEVPDDGQRYAVVGWKQWSELLALPEFASAQLAGDEQLPWRGAHAKTWLGTLWIAHSDLPAQGGVRTCFWYHRSAVGHAVGQEVVTDITWHADRAAHFVASALPQGAALIDGAGVLKMPCAEA